MPSLSWVKALRAIFPNQDRRRRPQRHRSLRAEVLEDRTAPAVFTPLSTTADGAPGSLRDAIIMANNDEDAVNTFNLDGGTYSLTIDNSVGQENFSGEGDLDLINLSIPPTKTYIFVGNGATINQTVFDRVFQALAGPTDGGVIVQFQNLTI